MDTNFLIYSFIINCKLKYSPLQCFNLFFVISVDSNVALEGHSSYLGPKYSRNYDTSAVHDGNLATLLIIALRLNPWWRINLKQAAYILQVNIYANRYWFRNGTLSVIDITKNTEKICAQNIGIDSPIAYRERVTCFMTGSLLKIQLYRNTISYLILNEVEIYGVYMNDTQHNL